MDRAAGQPSDESLLADFGAGERDALGALASRHERALLGLALGLLGSRELAEEAVQEAWVQVVRKAAAFDGRCAVRTWLYRIVINRCRDVAASEQARRTRERAAASGRPVASGPFSPGDDVRSEVRRAVARLAPSEREAVLLCHHADLTHAQAAEVLGVPPGTLKSRVRRAMSRLESGLRREVAR